MNDELFETLKKVVKEEENRRNSDAGGCLLVIIGVLAAIFGSMVLFSPGIAVISLLHRSWKLNWMLIWGLAITISLIFFAILSSVTKNNIKKSILGYVGIAVVLNITFYAISKDNLVNTYKGMWPIFFASDNDSINKGNAYGMQVSNQQNKQSNTQQPNVKNSSTPAPAKNIDYNTLCKNLINYYENGFAKAVNENKMDYIGNSMINGSNFYNNQKGLINDLYGKQTKLKLESYNITKISKGSTDRNIIANVEEKTELTLVDQKIVRVFYKTFSINIDESNKEHIYINEITITDQKDISNVPINTAPQVSNSNYGSNTKETAKPNNASNEAASDKYIIGGIKLLGDINEVNNKYKNYLTPSTDKDIVFFGNGNDKDVYGSFLLTIKKNNANKVVSVNYSEFKAEGSPPIKIGNIGVGATKDVVKGVYGNPTSDVTEYDVNRMIYNNINYMGSKISLIFYFDRKTGLLYGYEVTTLE
jgi:hypothetical protein